MTRLPELENALFEAAKRSEHPEQAPIARPRRPRTTRWPTPLLATIGTLLAAGVALAASGLLATGSPVPTSGRLAQVIGKITRGSSVVLPLRVADPDGGPPWAIAVFRARQPIGPKHENVICARVARAQDNTLGILGRDGAFGDDGKFHPLPVTAEQTIGCAGGINRHGQITMSFDFPPIPASGYTGSPNTPPGSCIDNALDGSTPTTTRATRCAASSLRIVKYGFAGVEATNVRYANDKFTSQMTPGISGAYLFVIPAAKAGRQHPTLTITYRDGTICKTTNGHSTPLKACNRPPGT